MRYIVSKIDTLTKGAFPRLRGKVGMGASITRNAVLTFPPCGGRLGWRDMDGGHERRTTECWGTDHAFCNMTAASATRETVVSPIYTIFRTLRNGPGASRQTRDRDRRQPGHRKSHCAGAGPRRGGRGDRREEKRAARSDGAGTGRRNRPAHHPTGGGCHQQKPPSCTSPRPWP